MQGQFYVYTVPLLQMLDGLRFAIHKNYNEFMKRNTNFSGTVSFFAHSLGRVMVYDLLKETCEERGVDHCHFQHNNTTTGQQIHNILQGSCITISLSIVILLQYNETYYAHLTYTLYVAHPGSMLVELTVYRVCVRATDSQHERGTQTRCSTGPTIFNILLVLLCNNETYYADLTYTCNICTPSWLYGIYVCRCGFTQFLNNSIPLLFVQCM